MKHEEYLKKSLEGPEFRAAYEALEPEYQLIRERIRASLEHKDEDNSRRNDSQ